MTHPLALRLREGRVSGIGMAGERALDAAQFRVAQVGEPALALARPELGEGEFQERQAGAASGADA